MYHLDPLHHTEPHCNTLQHTATHCNTPERKIVKASRLCCEKSVVLCCSVLQCVAVCCSVLQCVAVCCSVLQCVAVAKTLKPQCTASLLPKLQHNAIKCNTLQHTATYCNTSQSPAFLLRPKFLWKSILSYIGSRGCSVWRCVAECCRVLIHAFPTVSPFRAEMESHTATRCNTWQHTATHGNTLQHITKTLHSQNCATSSRDKESQRRLAVFVAFIHLIRGCSMLQRVAACCSVLQRVPEC